MEMLLWNLLLEARMLTCSDLNALKACWQTVQLNACVKGVSSGASGGD